MLTFYDYMMQYTHDSSVVGELARYIQGQENFPKVNDYSDIVQYLRINHASEDLIDTFEYVFSGSFKKVLRDWNRAQSTENFLRVAVSRQERGERPELFFMALIAKGLFEIADAIRERR